MKATMAEAVVTVTKKGQATIPKKMRERHSIGRKALVEDTEEGVLLKPLPSPSMERGSLRTLFKGRRSGEIMDEVRGEESMYEEKVSRRRAK
jgi:bifunctional DNA-binding transcriptional regulator/antitoxin component of YhaV-PrlF toxin-antitoxin module